MTRRFAQASSETRDRAKLTEKSDLADSNERAADWTVALR